MQAPKAPFARVWARIHGIALALSEQKSVPSARHAEAIVLQLLREENADLPPEYTVASLAHALRRAIQRQP